MAERVPHARNRCIGLRLRNGEADRAFRGPLEDRRYGKPGFVDRGKRARGDAVHTDHALPATVIDRLAREDRKRFDWIRLERLRADTRCPAAPDDTNDRTCSVIVFR